MVTYESMFQFALVLLTAFLVAAAFFGRKKKDQPPSDWRLILTHICGGITAIAPAAVYL